MIEQALKLFSPYVARVTAVNGTTPGPASGITYDVQLIGPQGSGRTWTAVEPTNQRWPDDIDVVALSVGDPVFAFWDGLKLHIWADEKPDLAADCAGA